MGKTILLALAVLAVPVVVLRGGGWILGRWSGRESVAPAGETPLYMRLHYDRPAVEKYWVAFGKNLGAERLFLELDLVFPFLYGGALAASFLIARAAMGWTFHPASLLAPVILGVVADWTENLVQLGQLRRYCEGQALQEGWIRAASTATAAKLLFLGGSYLLLVVVAGILFASAFSNRSS